MQLHLDRAPGINVIREYHADHVVINDSRWSEPVVLTAGSIEVWQGCALSALSEITLAELEPLLDHGVDVLIVGTGVRQRFLAPGLVAGLARRRVGVEVMDTRAACRTFNILAGDSRRVAALLFQEE
jgi:uncharacterized protein